MWHILITWTSVVLLIIVSVSSTLIGPPTLLYHGLICCYMTEEYSVWDADGRGWENKDAIIPHPSFSSHITQSGWFHFSFLWHTRTPLIHPAILPIHPGTLRWNKAPHQPRLLSILNGRYSRISDKAVYVRTSRGFGDVWSRLMRIVFAPENNVPMMPRLGTLRLVWKQKRSVWDSS